MKCSWLIGSIQIAALSIALGGAAVAGSDQQTSQVGQTFRDCSDCPEMVVIPAGSFLMGSSAEEAARDLEYVVPKGEIKGAREDMTLEHPQHEVSFSRAFAVGKYPVTRGEFATFVHETGYSVENGCTVWIDHTYPLRQDAGWQNPGFSQTNRDPLVCVNRQDIKAYLAWLNGKLLGRLPSEGDGPYRLPSEAEWEKSVQSFQRDLDEMTELVKNSRTDLVAKIPHGDGQTVLRQALVLADHNAYHLGQLVDLRRALGAWPHD